MNDWHTCPAAGPIRASNPCSEYMFLDDTACNLASLNLLQFKDAEHQEDQHCRLRTPPFACGRGAEISVMMAQFPRARLPNSPMNTARWPRLRQYRGLLMSSRIPYDSAEGRAICVAPRAIIPAFPTQPLRKSPPNLVRSRLNAPNRDNMLRVIPQPSPRRPCEAKGYEGLSCRSGPLYTAMHRSGADCSCQGCLDRALELGEKHATECAVFRNRADRHDRPCHGLRHHGHRAGISRW